MNNNIIAKENHERNLKVLSVPKSILPYLNLNVLHILSDKLSKITKQTFNYYGRFEVTPDNNVNIKLQGEEGEFIITINHDIVYDENSNDINNNIVFNGLNDLLSGKLQEEKEKIRATGEDIDKVLNGIKEDINRVEEEKKKRKQEKKKNVVMQVLGIKEEEEKEPEVKIESTQAKGLAKLLNHIDEQTKEEKEKRITEKDEKLANFMKALENASNTDDIEKKKKELFLKKLNNKLDNM